MALPIQFRVNLVDKSKTKEKLCTAGLDQSVWRLGNDIGMLELTTLHGCGYLFTSGRTWSSLRHPNLTLREAGVQDGSTVSFSGDLDPHRAPPLMLQAKLMDKSKTWEECGAAVPDTSVWDFGYSIGMHKLSSSSASYIFTYREQRWKSLAHPDLTFGDVGVGSGDVVTFQGNFEALSAEEAEAAAALRAKADQEVAELLATAPKPTKGAVPVPSRKEVQLTVVLMDKSKSREKSGKALLSSTVWDFGEKVGLYTLTTSDKSGGAYIFRRQGGTSWKSNRFPNLTLAEAGVQDGDTVEFMGDFDPKD
mmetsp:Transcript_57747/g.103979  ORF Transcript_57747/g.103979 Transcript_57747/m.103979 type:complete len:307 (+) Transcript_57747:44-964(+)